MVWNHSVATKTACVPHTPYTLILRFASPAGRVCGVATHAVGGNAGYGLLHLTLKVCVARSGRVCGVATHAVDRGAGYGLLKTTLAVSSLI